MSNFRTARTSGVERLRETLFSSLHSESSHCTAKSPAPATEGSRRRGRPGDSHRPREVTLGRSSSGWAVSGLDEPHQDPESAWRLLVSSRLAGWATSAWITAASLGWARDERGHDADPPDHAVRVRGVLQLDGLRELLGALRTCRNEGVSYARVYAHACITFHVQAARLRRSGNCCATFSCRRIEPDRIRAANDPTGRAASRAQIT
jgi:hypothetical protein